MTKKIVLSKVRGGLFLYIILKFNYKFDSQLLQYFSFDFLISLSCFPLFLLHSLLLSSLFAMCMLGGCC